MNKSKKSVSTQENLNHSPNPAINELVESVGSHASDSDKAILAELIYFGDKRKAEGERIEKEWWGRKLKKFKGEGGKIDKRKLFQQRCLKFSKLKEIRKEKEQENLKALFSNEMMVGYLLDKYIEEYLYKWILYYPSKIDNKIIDGDINEVEGYDAVLTYLRAGNMEPGVTINLGENNIGPAGAKEIAEAIKELGLVSGVKIDFCRNRIGDFGAQYMLEVIKQTGLPVGSEIDLRFNRISPKMKEQLSELNETVEGEILFE